jgi:SAM-dependent methyltransferase
VPDELAPVRPGQRPWPRLVRSQVQEAYDGILRFETQGDLYLLVVGGAAGLPHTVETERQRGMQHVLCRRPRGENLLDRGNFPIGRDDRRDDHDERSTESLESLALQRFIGDGTFRTAQMIGQQLAEGRARFAIDHDEAPRPQSSMVCSPGGALEYEPKRGIIRCRFFQCSRGMAPQQGFDRLHENQYLLLGEETRGIVAQNDPALPVSGTAMQFSVSEAADRNKAPILEIIAKEFAQARRVLEIGSGTGQHALYFAARLPHASWQPSDIAEYLPALRERIRLEGGPNLRAVVELDVRADPWPAAIGGPVDAVFSANTLHIMSWSSVQDFFRGVGSVLGIPGVLCVYGPFRYGGRYTSESNAVFDDYLRSRDPESGIRDFEALDDLARKQGLTLAADHAMPANNQLLVWKKHAATHAVRRGVASSP